MRTVQTHHGFVYLNKPSYTALITSRNSKECKKRPFVAYCTGVSLLLELLKVGKDWLLLELLKVGDVGRPNVAGVP